jgi:hypothetical protein
MSNHDSFGAERSPLFDKCDLRNVWTADRANMPQRPTFDDWDCPLSTNKMIEELKEETPIVFTEDTTSYEHRFSFLQRQSYF